MQICYDFINITWKLWTNRKRFYKINQNDIFSHIDIREDLDIIMKKFGYFIKSLFPVVMVFILQIVAAIPTMAYYMWKSSENGGDFLSGLTGLTNNLKYIQTLNIVYAILALFVFGLWYYRVFVKPFRNRPRKQPGGYSFHTIVSILLLGIGLQYVTTLLTDALGVLRPELISKYNEQMSSQGYNDLSIMLLTYSILLAPIVEELVFRGLVFRFARHAMPFWFANTLSCTEKAKPFALIFTIFPEYVLSVPSKWIVHPLEIGIRGYFLRLYTFGFVSICSLY